MARRLLEGFSDKVANQIRHFFARAPETQQARLMRGVTPSLGAPLAGASLGVQQYDGLSAQLRVDQDLMARYQDVESMDEYPEIASALDIYADDATMPNLSNGKTAWVTSENERLAKDLDEVLHKQIRIEDDIWGIVRTLAKYGQCYAENLVTQQGLVGLSYLPPPTVRRIEGPRGELIGFLQDGRGEFSMDIEEFYRRAKEASAVHPSKRDPNETTVFEDWELVHMRLRSKHLRSVYGSGVVDSARWIWKRLNMLEDAVLVYKLSRAPSRYAFYVDVGSLDHERGRARVNQVKNEFAKKRFVTSAGKIDTRYNPLSHSEDFFLPTSGGKDSTRIEVLSGPDYSEVETLEYHRDKLVAALKVPRAYLGYGGEATKASLSTEDIKFARTVMRLQREVRMGLKKSLRVHMIAVGAEDVDDHDFDVVMSVPSAILELSKLEVMSATADVATRLQEIVSIRWILVNLFKFTDDEAAMMMKEKSGELKDRAKLDADAQGMMVSAQQDAMPAEAPDFVAGSDEEEEEPVAQAAEWMRRRRMRGEPLAERRLSQKLTAVQRDWERTFDRRMGSSWKVEDKLQTLLRTDQDLRRRLRNLEGLLSDIRASMRAA